MLSSKSVKRRSLIQEKRVAGEIPEGKTTPQSGAQFHAKGDVHSPQFLTECKTTQNDSYSIKKAEFEKLMDQALSKGLDPVLQVDLPNLSLAVVPWPNFLFMMGDEKLISYQKERMDYLEKCIKILIHELFKRNEFEHTDEVYDLLLKRIFKGDIPDISLKI